LDDRLRGTCGDVGAGFKPALVCGGKGEALPRHCEAPVSPRYVQCYRCEAIQCRGDNIQPTSLRIAGYYVNPGLLRRISLTTYRKCGGGFAKTGRAKPCPVPAHRAGTVDDGRVRARRGIPPRRYAAPLSRGEFTGEGGFETRPYERVAQFVHTHMKNCGL
jgi:hypothetical protein